MMPAKRCGIGYVRMTAPHGGHVDWEGAQHRVGARPTSCRLRLGQPGDQKRSGNRRSSGQRVCVHDRHHHRCDDRTDGRVPRKDDAAPLAGADLEVAWAAGLWVLLYNAKKECAGGGRGYLDHLERELHERMVEAGR